MRVLTVHHEVVSGLGTLEAPIAERGHQLEHWNPWADEPAPDVAGFGAVVVLGGVANVDEEHIYPWLTRERAALRALVEAGRPTLGICLGAQLLAAVLQAPVARMPEHELGWHEVELTEAAARDPLLAGFPSRFPAFQWHDFGFAAPAAAVDLARSPRVPSQAFRYGDHVWALQFHIEVDDAIVRRWIDTGREEMASKGVPEAALLADTARLLAGYSTLASDMMHRFLAIAEAVESARAA